MLGSVLSGISRAERATRLIRGVISGGQADLSSHHDSYIPLQEARLISGGGSYNPRLKRIKKMSGAWGGVMNPDWVLHPGEAVVKAAFKRGRDYVEETAAKRMKATVSPEGRIFEAPYITYAKYLAAKKRSRKTKKKKAKKGKKKFFVVKG